LLFSNRWFQLNVAVSLGSRLSSLRTVTGKQWIYGTKNKPLTNDQTETSPRKAKELGRISSAFINDIDRADLAEARCDAAVMGCSNLAFTAAAGLKTPYKSRNPRYDRGGRSSCRALAAAVTDDGKPHERSIMAIYRFENGRIAGDRGVSIPALWP
jgi:hypothetical protein